MKLPALRALATAGLGLVCLLHARAQPPPAKTPLEFEVASVKPSTSGFNGVRGSCHGIDSKYSSADSASAPPLGRCVITDGRLSHLITIAYKLPSVGMIQGAQDWMIAGAERFTIAAKVEDPAKTTEAQLLEMLQSLLVDRFKLKFHRESKDVPGYALVVAKNGPKFQESKSDEGALSFPKPSPGEPINLTARKLSMAALVNVLSVVAPGPVIDQTGLNGEYDLKLSWDEAAGPSLFTAVQEQLGLRLNAQKVPTSYFVIESVQRPSAN